MKQILFIITILFSYIGIAQTKIVHFPFQTKPSSQTINFGIVTTKQSKSDTIKIVNLSKKHITFSANKKPDNIQIYNLKESLLYKDTLNLIVTISPQKKTKYGPNSDRIILNTNDSITPKFALFFNYIILEDFSSMDSTSLSERPIIKLLDSLIDLGTLPQLTEKKISIRIKNEGLSSLYLRRLKLPTGVSTDKDKKQEILPGQEIILTLYFNSGMSLGEIDRSIVIVCNDPNKPISYIKLSANVIKKSNPLK